MRENIYEHFVEISYLFVDHVLTTLSLRSTEIIKGQNVFTVKSPPEHPAFLFLLTSCVGSFRLRKEFRHRICFFYRKKKKRDVWVLALV